MKNLINGCSYTETWVSPANWQTLTAKKSLKLIWYVACKFYDPNFENEYSNGFLFKKRLNRYKTLEERKRAVIIVKSEMDKMLSEGYNPILGEFMHLDIYEAQNTEIGLIDALNRVFKNKLGAYSTIIDIRSVLNYFGKSAKVLNLYNKPINQVRRADIKAILNNVYNINENFTDKRYNKYVKYLSGLFSDMEELEIIESNPMIRMKSKKTVHKLKEVLTNEQRERIKSHIYKNYPDYWIFINIYFNAGCRLTEIMNLKISDLDMDNQRFKVLVKKGRDYYEKYYPIKDIALKYWYIHLSHPHKKTDYLFQFDYKPGPRKSDRHHPSRLWKTVVKDELKIKIDLSSLRHLNLDEITMLRSLGAAAVAGGHTSTRMVEKHYAVRERERQVENLKSVDNEF